MVKHVGDVIRAQYRRVGQLIRKLYEIYIYIYIYIERERERNKKAGRKSR